MNRTASNKKLKLYSKWLPLFVIVCAMTLAEVSPLHAGTLDFSGQASTWLVIDPQDLSEIQAGARYIPELSYSQNLSDIWEISAEAALNVYGFETSGETGGDFETGLYRLWVRLASPQLEIRTGLQKISFGPGALLRPLMWFDTVDPRDPLQLTRGVYGLLARYYFVNNANIWIWGLYGNDRLRGWQTVPSGGNDPEYGCRMQVPLGTGEIAFSYHHRIADPEGTFFGSHFPTQGKFEEDAFALDGKWDAGFGLWFEGTVTCRDLDVPAARYLRMLTLGMDYTFDLGNGLHVLAEHLFRGEAEDALDTGHFTSFSALAIDYPLNIFDALSAILYYDHEKNDLSAFVQWQRTYDDWQVYLSVFRNPDRTDSLSGEGYAAITGDGLRLMFVYNH